MNPTPGTPAHPSTPVFDFDARFMTAIIPVRWRAGVLVLATVTLFPVLITVMLFDIVTHEMPGLRAPFERTLRMVSGWFRVRRVSESPGAIPFPSLAAAPSSLRRGTV